ncbi:MAG: hypothetical protein AAF490_13245 [Chloroflexota bacterium]
MSDETPSVEEIKERLKIEVEEEPTKADANPDVVAELQNLGRQFASTLQSAWNSEERQRIESEVREGMKSFVNEVDKAFQTAKDSSAAERIKSEATNVTNKVGSSDVGTKARSGIVQGLKWMSIELEKLADKFTNGEKEVADDTAESE